MQDGTRVIFWIDIAILLIVAVLVLAGQWDYVIALFVALIALNFFDQWRSRWRPRN
jgi:chromate transport protein ChrA